MDKIYHKTTWQNSPSTNTPINETNLNNIENGVDAIDNRVVDLGNTKSSVDWVQLQQSGDKIAEITIDGVKKAVYSKQASGSVLDNALKSEGFAVGTQDGQPVSSGSPYFENNAKYYAEDSARSSAESKYWSEKSGSSRLVSMDDVDINSPQDKQALVYDATSQKWVNGQGGGSSVNVIDNLESTSTTDALSANQGRVLKQDLNNYEQTTDEEIDGIKSSLAQLKKIEIQNFTPSASTNTVIETLYDAYFYKIKDNLVSVNMDVKVKSTSSLASFNIPIVSKKTVSFGCAYVNPNSVGAGYISANTSTVSAIVTSNTSTRIIMQIIIPTD